MTQLYFKNDVEQVEELQLREGETVLSGLLRHGVDVPFGCKTGVCQSCMMVAPDTKLPREAQKGLREVQKRQGYFLSCCCKPKEPMLVSLSCLHKKESTEVIGKSMLSDQVLRLRLRKVLSYRPGQYATLWKNSETARTYSFVSCPAKDYMEFHIRIYPGGVFSQWAVEELKLGQSLEIQGPMGECYYAAESKDQPLFLSGLGTGLAPLFGVARDALEQGHTGHVLMLLGARQSQGLYFQRELAILQQQYPNLDVRYSVQEIPSELKTNNGRSWSIYEATQAWIPDFTGYRVFLAGGASFVQKMRKQCFLAGANMGDISADTFLSFPA